LFTLFRVVKNEFLMAVYTSEKVNNASAVRAAHFLCLQRDRYQGCIVVMVADYGIAVFMRFYKTGY